MHVYIHVHIGYSGAGRVGLTACGSTAWMSVYVLYHYLKCVGICTILLHKQRSGAGGDDGMHVYRVDVGICDIRDICDICVLILYSVLLYMCPHSIRVALTACLPTAWTSVYGCRYMCRHTTLLYKLRMCPHAILLLCKMRTCVKHILVACGRHICVLILYYYMKYECVCS
jgi:hypothetical protein